MLDKHIAWFKAHAASFLTGAPEYDTHIELKIEHSLAVLAEAKAITPTLALSQRLVQAAHLAALYHDIGRFPQYRRYRTFQDSRSANHAHLGVRALRQEKASMPPIDASLRPLVLGGVILHNRRDIPRGISPELAVVAKIVRDSDKLDITRVMLDYLRPGGKTSDVVTLHVADEPEKYSPEIIAQIQSGRIGDYSSMRFKNDFTLILLSWVNDLNFKASRQAFLDRGHAEELFGFLPDVPEIARLKGHIDATLRKS